MGQGKVKAAMLFGRWSLSAAFLSAVADRLGLWGQRGTPNVTWGSFDHFLKDVALLNPWAPESWVSALGWTATGLEVACAVFLISGYKIRAASLVSGSLLTVFGVSMVLNMGAQSALNFSVFSAAACAFLMASIAKEAPKDEKNFKAEKSIPEDNKNLKSSALIKSDSPLKISPNQARKQFVTATSFSGFSFGQSPGKPFFRAITFPKRAIVSRRLQALPLSRASKSAQVLTRVASTVVASSSYFGCTH